MTLSRIVPITPAILELCGQIIEHKWNVDEWAEHESDGWFQNNSYVGGFDAEEREFCFSYFPNPSEELLFQFPLSAAEDVLKGKIDYFKARLAE